MGVDIEISEAFKPLFKPWRYKVYYGGRGAGKSYTFAMVLLLLCSQKKTRVLCTREHQNSIKDSVHKLLSDCIANMKMDAFYTITRDSIIGVNGSEFIFQGLKHQPHKIKSLEGVDICWVEEAQSISNESWQILIPTIRKAGSEIWLSMNPNLSTDPTYKRFLTKPYRDNQITIKVNYDNNRFLSDELKKEMEYMKEVDYQGYLHVWLGECRTSTEAQIFKGKYIVHDFETPNDAVFYHGLDWGFSTDPLAIVRCWIRNQELYIDYEAGGLGVELDYTHREIDRIPNAKNYIIRADNARPESISFVKRQGYMIEPVYKWSGSIEDGIAFMKSFRQIHVHSRCLNTANEFMLYNYKQDRLSGDILPDIIDENNHYMDGIRYALQPLIKRKGEVKIIKMIGFY